MEKMNLVDGSKFGSVLASAGAVVQTTQLIMDTMDPREMEDEHADLIGLLIMAVDLLQRESATAVRYLAECGDQLMKDALSIAESKDNSGLFGDSGNDSE